MLKISVISYKGTILRVHRSVLRKYLRFPDQHVKRNIDTPNDTGYTQQSFIRGVTAPEMNPLPIYVPFLTKKVSSFLYFPLKNGVLYTFDIKIRYPPTYLKP